MLQNLKLKKVSMLFFGNEMFSQRVYKTNIDFEKAVSILTEHCLSVGNVDEVEGPWTLRKAIEELETVPMRYAWVNEKGHLNFRFRTPSMPVQLTRNGYLIIKGGSICHDPHVYVKLICLVHKPGGPPPELRLMHYSPGSEEISALTRLPFAALAKGKTLSLHKWNGIFIRLKNLAEWLRKIIPEISPGIGKKEVERTVESFLFKCFLAQLQVPPDLNLHVIPIFDSSWNELAGKGLVPVEEMRFHVHKAVQILLLESLFHRLKEGLIGF